MTCFISIWTKGNKNQDSSPQTHTHPTALTMSCTISTLINRDQHKYRTEYARVCVCVCGRHPGYSWLKHHLSSSTVCVEKTSNISAQGLQRPFDRP